MINIGVCFLVSLSQHKNKVIIHFNNQPQPSGFAFTEKYGIGFDLSQKSSALFTRK